MPFKKYVIRLRNLTSINIIFSSPQKILVFLYNCKEKAQNKQIKKPFKNLDFFKSNMKEHLFCRTSANDCF